MTAPTAVRGKFAVDSPLEGDGFELSVPPCRKRWIPFGNGNRHGGDKVRLEAVAYLPGTAGAQQPTPRGQLRVYCQQGIVQFVAPVVVDFLARYPEASVDLRTGHAMIDLVEDAFDLAISAQPPPDATLVRRRLATLSLLLWRPGLPRKVPAPQSPADLADHNCLRYPYAPLADGWHFLDANGTPVVVRISGSLISSSPDVMRAAAVAGIGLVMTAPFPLADLLTSGALVPLLPGTGLKTSRSTRSIPTAGI